MRGGSMIRVSSAYARQRLQPLSTILSYKGLRAVEEMRAFWEVEPNVVPADVRPSKFGDFNSGERLAMALCSPWAALNVFEKINDVQRRLLYAILEAGQNALQASDLAPIAETLQTLTVEVAPLIAGGVLIASYGPEAQYYDYSRPRQVLTAETYLVVIPNLARHLSVASELVRSSSKDVLDAELRAAALSLDPFLTGAAMGLDAALLVDDVPRPASLLAANLEEPECVRKLLGQLSAEGRKLFDGIAKEGGPVPLDSLFPPTLSRPERLPRLMELHDRGLIFPAFPDGKQACYVHPAVIAALQGTRIPPPPVSDEMAPAPDPPVVKSETRHFSWNAVVIANWIDSGEAALTATTGMIPKRILKQLERVIARWEWLLGTDADQVTYTLQWMIWCGLVSDVDLRLALTAAGKDWLNSTVEDQVAATTAEWLNGIDSRYEGDWEIAEAAPGDTSSILRPRLLDLLRELPVGTWFRIEALCYRLLARDPYVLRSADQIRMTAGLAADRYLRGAWLDFEGLALAVELCNLPYQLGLVDVGWESTRHPNMLPPFFRITEMGAQVMAQLKKSARWVAVKQKKSEPGRTLLVQANMEMVLMEFDPRVAYAVSQFSQPIGFDRAATFNLTPESVRSAASRGITLQRMLKTLNSFSAQPLPQNVEYQLNDWAGSIEEVRFERGTVVEVGSSEALNRLLACKAIHSRLLRRLSPTAALLSVGEDVSALARSLKAEGFQWTPPSDWEQQEAAAFRSLTRTLRRFGPRTRY